MALKTVLLTAGDSLAARSIQDAAPDGVAVIALCPGQKNEKPGFHSADPADRAALAALFREYSFDSVVLGLGPEDEPSTAALALHAAITRNVTELCAECGTYLLYLSGNAVFDGSAAPYSEDDPVAPLTPKGRTQVECEIITVTGHEDCAVARHTRLFDAEGFETGGVPLAHALRAGMPVALPDDLLENPVYAPQFGMAVWRMLETRPWGAVHIAGPDTVSLYDLGRRAAAAAGLSNHNILPAHGTVMPDAAHRPVNLSLNTVKMEQDLGITPVSLDIALAARVDAAPE